MRIPVKAPDDSTLAVALAHPGSLSKIMAASEASANERSYLHWDELRHRTPPDGLSLQEWWLALRLHRGAMRKQVPLRDRDGKLAGVVVTDEMQRRLHELDLGAGGRIQMPEPVANEASRDQYLVSSLIEEAITSSQLEGAVTTRKVAKQMLRERRPPVDRSERMIRNNYETMRRIRELTDTALTPSLVFELHRLITDDTLDDPSAAGRFRRPDEDVHVADGLGTVYFVPPSASELPERLEALCAFANDGPSEGFVHPVLRSMILHFWLAYDHPFVDGNGRTARALFYWSMLRHGYWLAAFVSISSVLRKEPKRYGRAFLLTETDDNDLTYFLLYHLDVLGRAIDALHDYIARKTEQVRHIELALRGSSLLNHRQRAIVGHALRHPGTRYTIEGHRRSHGVVYQTARTDLLDLCERELFRSEKRGRKLVFSALPELERRLGELS